jgi:hypothetical protein
MLEFELFESALVPDPENQLDWVTERARLTCPSIGQRHDRGCSPIEFHFRIGQHLSDR